LNPLPGGEGFFVPGASVQDDEDPGAHER